MPRGPKPIPSANPLVAGARFAQCYTVSTTYWIDLVRDPNAKKPRL